MTGQLDLYNNDQLGRPANKRMFSYLPPQFYWYKSWSEVTDEMIDAGVAKLYVHRFGLTPAEIRLAETFFTGR